MYEEIIKSARASLNERLASPLMGSFIISWVLWNYKFLVILFSSSSVIETFELIKDISFPDTSALLLRGIIFPGLTAAAYIFLYPYPAKFVYEFTRNRQKEINDIRRRIDDETPLTLEESRKIKAELFRVEQAHREQIDNKNIEIQQLKEEVSLLRSSQPSTKSEVKKVALTSKFSSEQLDILKLIENNNGRVSRETVFSLIGNRQPQIKTQYDLEDLAEHSLLNLVNDPISAGMFYEITPTGRSFLLSHARN